MPYMIHDFDQVAFYIGGSDGLAIRWYALAYIVGILAGLQIIKILDLKYPKPLQYNHDLDDLLLYLICGIILGGRFFFVIIYDLHAWRQDWLLIFKIWEGGMSFHGGMVGVAISLYLYSKRYKCNFWRLTDLVETVAPLGLMLGRIANFINGELYGRVTTVSWGVIFPQSGTMLPRHPSQLYEAITEGLLLLCIMLFLFHKTNIKSIPGKLTAVFLGGYSFMRISMETFREPNINLGFILQYFTTGQILSFPMLLLAIYLYRYSSRV